MTTRLHENRDGGHAEWRHMPGHKYNGQATSRCASTSSRRICLVVCNLGYLLTVKAWRKPKRPVLIITENPDSSHNEAMAWSFTESSWDLWALSMHSGRKRKQGDNRIATRKRTRRLQPAYQTHFLISSMGPTSSELRWKILVRIWHKTQQTFPIFNQ